MNRFVFGPVPSRRLGRSLGIDLTPSKTCSFDCRYCQLSATRFLTAERQPFCSPRDVLDELCQVLENIEPPDWITFSGTGEPTLHSGLGELLRAIKALAVAPICVITNGSLLWRPDVRADLDAADHVLPTLTTVLAGTFAALHQPAPGLTIDQMLSGLRAFSGEFPGEIDLEIFVCPDLNDTPAEIDGLRGFILTLPRLSSVYLNTSVRAPQDTGLKVATAEDLDAFRRQLDLPHRVHTVYEQDPLPRPSRRKRPPTVDDVTELLLRHPCTVPQLELVLDAPALDLTELLELLRRSGKAERASDGFWRLVR